MRWYDSTVNVIEVASAAAAVRTKPSPFKRSMDFSSCGRSLSRNSSKIVLCVLFSAAASLPLCSVLMILSRMSYTHGQLVFNLILESRSGMGGFYKLEMKHERNAFIKS